MAIIIITFVRFKDHLLIFMISLSIWVPCCALLVMTNSLINEKKWIDFLDILVPFEWKYWMTLQLELKRNEMEIDGEGIENLFVNMVLGNKWNFQKT